MFDRPLRSAPRLSGSSSSESHLSGRDSDAAFVTPELLRLAASGDESSWESLVRLLSPKVTQTIASFVRSRDEHADIAQEVFVKLFLKLEQYGASGEFHHWVHRITLNTCRDCLRRLQRRQTIMAEAPNEVNEPTVHDEAQRQLQTKEAAELVERLIERLGPNDQIVIRLLDLEERSIAEVSELTGWSASRVKVTAYRARQKLRKIVTKLSPTCDD
jgi:RNA polymerase sigma-70 factor (ECF subfamily)